MTVETFEKLKEEAETDSDILGFFLSGSRGKGFGGESSDYDIVMIVKDDKTQFYEEKFSAVEDKEIDLTVFSYSEFEHHAEWGGDKQWDRYNYAHCRALVDKNGTIQTMIDEKGKVPEDELKHFIEGALDAYINYLFRSLKCHRDGNILGARLEATYSIPFMLDVVFAIHGRRLRPYYKYLEWELKTYQLEKLTMSPNEFMAGLAQILDDADPSIQQRYLEAIEETCKIL